MGTRLTREVRFGVHEAEPTRATGGGKTANSFAGEPLLAGLVPFVTVGVQVAGELEAATGMLVNVKLIDAVVRGAAVDLVKAGTAKAPLALGRLAGELLEHITQRLKGRVEVEAVALAASPYLKVEARTQERPMVRLSQRFEFSAAHRLHSAALSDDENRQVFERCNNPNGHGHNYELEVTVMGEPDGPTGMVMPVAELQRIVNEHVIEAFDHKHLNLDCAEFREPGGMNPTVENIARVVHGRLSGRFGPGVKLAGVKLWETPKTMAEFSQ